MSRIVLALGMVCLFAGWNPTANAQSPYYGSAYGASYSGHHHHHQSPQLGYGANYGYTPPVMMPPAPSYGGYGPGYGPGYASSPGYGMGGYPNAGYYPAQPQPNSGHHHHHHHQQPVYQPPYQPTYPAPYPSHPWHLGHYLLGT